MSGLNSGLGEKDFDFESLSNSFEERGEIDGGLGLLAGINLSKKDDLNEQLEKLSTGKGNKIAQRNAKISKLISDGDLTHKELNFARSLTFSSQDIIDFTYDIKRLVELVENNTGKEVINYKTLRGFVRDNNKDIDKIKEAIRNEINIEDLSLSLKVLVMSILDIGE